MNFPYLQTDNKEINTAYRLAIATLAANILPFRDGILTKPEPVIIAGLGYATPWTRDAAINTWNAGALICPEVSRSTLESVLTEKDGVLRIGGEYWDAIIWVTGAWQQYLCTGDREFLEMAHRTSVNSLAYFEATEFDANKNLFRGPACYGDGIAAYPDVYAQHGTSAIMTFAKENRDLCVATGVGIPMFALSTNCLYYHAYVLADKMAAALGLPCKTYAEKAARLKEAINAHFWSEEKQNYTYLCDPFGGCNHQEGLGASFALLFGIADEEKAEKVLAHQHITPHGIPCVWPTFDRYLTPDHKGYGRHSGTVWPHVQGFWADAAARRGHREAFDSEFLTQTQNAIAHEQFAEIYHPDTGEIYGGRQEGGSGIIEWLAQPYQTWSATAYLRNVYRNLAGMSFEEDGIRFAPVGSSLTSELTLSNVVYRDAILTIRISGSGSTVAAFLLDDMSAENLIPCDIKGTHEIRISLD